MQVTSLDRLREIAKGEVVSLPGFIDGEPFNARLKRISLMDMILAGKIPNPLLDKADEIFTRMENKANNTLPKKLTKKEQKEIETMEKVMLGSIMVEPKYSEVLETGLELSELQKASIISYGMSGVNMFDNFRSKQGSFEPNKTEQTV